MNEHRKGEIALLYLRFRSRQGGAERLLARHDWQTIAKRTQRLFDTIRKRRVLTCDEFHRFADELFGSIPDSKLPEKQKQMIAYELVRLEARHNDRGYRFDGTFRRRIGAIAKDIGIPFDEAMTFMRELLIEVLTEAIENTCRPKTANGVGSASCGSHQKGNSVSPAAPQG